MSTACGDAAGGEETDTNKKEEGKKERTEERQTVGFANVLMKILLAGSAPGISPDVVAALASFVSNVAHGSNPDEENDVNLMRQLLRELLVLAKNAVKPADGMESKLTISMTDLLRTLAHEMMTEDTKPDLEYTATQRDLGLQSMGIVCDMLRDDEERKKFFSAYSTAEAMSKTFKWGIFVIEEMLKWSREDMHDFLERTFPQTSFALTCMVWPMLFDGDRLYAGLAAGARVCGSKVITYGIFDVAKKVLMASRTRPRLAALQKTFAVVVAMARSNEDIKESDVETELNALENRVVERMHDRSTDDTSAMCKILMEETANWFEEAMTLSSNDGFNVLYHAFTSRVLTIGNVRSDVKELWEKDLKEGNCDTFVSLWEAAAFLVNAAACSESDVPTACSEPAVRGMCMTTAVQIVLGGLVGNCQAGQLINGPFVINDKAGFAAARVSARLPRVLCDPTRLVGSVVGDDRIRTRGRVVGNTLTLKALLEDAERGVRVQHERTELVHNRLIAALVNHSIRENLRRWVPPMVSCVLSQGSKDLRRMHMVQLQKTPGIESDSNGFSHLVQRRRVKEEEDDDEDDGSTNHQNVEKPSRDVNGNSVAATFLFCLSGFSLVKTVEELAPDGKLKSTTVECCEEFRKQLVSLADYVFDPSVLKRSHKIADNMHEVRAIFEQQRAFVRAYSEVIQGTPTMWEGLQLDFCAVPTMDDGKSRKRRSSKSPSAKKHQRVATPADAFDSPRAA
jgi:hypothetical protein